MPSESCCSVSPPILLSCVIRKMRLYLGRVCSSWFCCCWSLSPTWKLGELFAEYDSTKWELRHRRQGLFGLLVGQGPGFLVWVCQQKIWLRLMVLKDDICNDLGPTTTKLKRILRFFCGCIPFLGSPPGQVGMLPIACCFKLHQLGDV